MPKVDYARTEDLVKKGPQLFVNTENVAFVSDICGNSAGALNAVPFVVHFSAYICFVAGSANFGSHAGQDSRSSCLMKGQGCTFTQTFLLCLL